MTKNIKLKDESFEETEQVLRKIKRPRNAYINEATQFCDKPIAGRLLKNKLIRESNMVAADSMTVLEEFERFEEQYSLNDLSGQGHGGERK